MYALAQVCITMPNPYIVAPLQELVRKKRYGRLQKALADVSLLAGSPADAHDHYTTAAELSRVSNDWLWTASALQGLAHAKVNTQRSIHDDDNSHVNNDTTNHHHNNHGHHKDNSNFCINKLH